MQYFILLALSSIFLTSFAPRPDATAQWRDGDIIFQISQSSQCKAIQEATKSPYAHVGILFQDGGSWFVLEAVQPVVYTQLSSWITHGERSHYVVKRLKDPSVITPTAIACMKKQGGGYLGKSYDLTFEWSDDRIYCSELVWKLYKNCLNIEVGQLKKLGDFDLTSPIVAAKLKERYGNKVPLDETVISPADMFNDDQLVTVFSN